ncbi:neuraminidase [Influenza A virus]|uniref:Neuraminidase n=1 Tax=Influenza A virus TaxID=11320 RepID=A0A3G1QT81_9INFA|nr:neuraminidase [Influenza A virus]
MNPNQKIITIGTTSVILSIICISIQVALLSLTIKFKIDENNEKTEKENNITTGKGCHPIIINNTVREIKIKDEKEFWNWEYYQCEIKGFAPFSKDNGIRLAAEGDIWITREPYISCDDKTCYQFALGQGTTLKNRHSNGTVHDRSPYRTLLMNEIGIPFNLNTRQVCIAWSSSSCFDGKGWLHICVTGSNKNATASIIYKNKLTDSIRSWNENILRTQESECVCINGTCPVVMTDGSAAGPSDTRVLFIRKGKIIKISKLRGSAEHIEECSCYPKDGDVKCVCRDNWKGSNRPFILINMKDMETDSYYVCSGLVGDTPRLDDKESSSDCITPNNERGSPGVKGWAFEDGDDLWMGRTISKDSRSGFETFKVLQGWVTPNSKEQILKQTIVGNTDWSGYSGLFSIVNGNCINRCFYVELIRGRPREPEVWWTSNSLVSFCGTNGTYGTGSWPDGAILEYMPI